MKKIAALLSLFFIFLGSYAQLVKEHAFNDQTSINVQLVRLENSGQKYCLINEIDSVTYQCIFYNLDYSVFKTINIDLEPLIIASPFSSPSLYIEFASENVFNTDNEIELLAHLTYYDDQGGLYAQVLVFHENGQVLFASDVENTNAYLLNSYIANGSILSSLTNTDSGAKMILDVYYFSTSEYSYDVYTLPGSISTSVKEGGVLKAATDGYLHAYPIPASDYVNMDYKLPNNQIRGQIDIIDQQGKTVQKASVNRNQGTLRLPVSRLNNGTYLYRVSTKRDFPRTGKILIAK